MLVPDVDLRRGIVADQNRREAQGAELRYFLRDFGADPRRKRLPVHYRRHGDKLAFDP